MSDENRRLLSRDDLKKLGVSYSNVHLLRLEEIGAFPRRIHITPARVAWIESEILTFIDRCIALRGPNVPSQPTERMVQKLSAKRSRQTAP